MKKQNKYALEKKRVWAKRNSQEYHQSVGDYATSIDNKVVLSFLAHQKGSLLDIPIGSGRTAQVLKNKFKVTGADYSQKMLNFTAKNVGVKTVKADAFNLPFSDNSFDNIVTLRLLFHYPNYPEIISELHRVLKKNGLLVCDTLNPISWRRFVAFFLDAFRSNKMRRLTFSSIRQNKEIFTSLGFKVEKIESRYILPTRSYRFLPSFLKNFFAWIERNIYPNSLKVVNFWKVRKIK